MLKLPIGNILKLDESYELVELYNLYEYYSNGFFIAYIFTKDSTYFIGLIDTIQVRMISYSSWWFDDLTYNKMDDFGRLVGRYNFTFPKTNLVMIPPIPVSLRIINIPLDIFTDGYKNYINLLLRKMYLYEHTKEISNDIYLSYKGSEELTKDNKFNFYDEMMGKLNYQLQDEIEELHRNYPIDFI